MRIGMMALALGALAGCTAENCAQSKPGAEKPGVQAKPCAAASCAQAKPGASGVVYEENFQKIGDFPPGVVPRKGEVGVDNEPCWEQYFAMWVRAKSDFAVWEKGIPLAKGDFDFSFEFNNNSATGVTLDWGKGSVTVTNKLGWSAMQLKGRGGKGTLWVMKNRVYEKFAENLDVAGAAAINFAAKSNANFSVKNVRSEKAVEGFAVDSSLKRLYADYASLEQPFAGTACEAPTVVEIPAVPRARLRFQLGKGAVSVACESTDRRTKKTAFATNAVTVSAENKMGDWKLAIPGIATRWVRPHLFAFGSRSGKIPQYADLMRDWRETPGASNHVVTVDFVRAAGGTQVWLDGNYLRTENVSRPYAFIFSKGAKYELTTVEAEKPEFVKLDFKANPKAKAFAKAALSGVKSGRQLLGGGKIPVEVAEPIDSQDVAICHQAKGAWALEVEEYFSENRGPLTGFPGESHFIVPGALYHKLAFAFALDPDPKKDAILTVTFARYAGEIGGNKLTQQTYDFTKGVPEWCRKVGEVKLGGKAVPLYYAEVPVNLGKILDFTAGGKLDVEFTGKLWENFQQDDKSMRPDPASRSAFNLFGATLVKAGFTAETVLSAPANVYTADEKVRKTALKVTGAAAGAKGEIVCEVRDVDGREVANVKKSFSLAAGEEKTVELDYSAFGPGWYELWWKARAGGEEIFAHKGALAVLPEFGKGRLVSREKSPYATWLFMGTHGAPTNKAWAGQLLQKAGIRKAGFDRKLYDKYDLTSIGAAYAPGEWDVLKTNYEALVVAKIKQALKDNPFIDHVMLWHESAPGGADQAYELLGIPVPPPSEAWKRRYDRTAKYVTETGRIVHKHFPGLRLQIGNTSASLGAVTYPMRGGVDWSSYDSIGFESPSQMVPPERFNEVGLLGLFAAQTLASKAAGRKMAVNGCYEFIYRSERDIGQELQGQYQARDIAICLAHGFTLISPGIFFDCSSGYYNGLWGGSGIMERGPWCYPKRAYVAYAVATKVLDGATYVRSLDTGSSTIYALEFKRLDGKTVTATWSARGTYDFDFDGAAELVSLYGGKGEKKGGGRIVYAVSDKPLANFRVSNRAFPFEDGLFKDAAAVCDLSQTKFAVEPDPAVASTVHNFWPQLKPGEFEVKPAKDAVRGDCVEVTLKSDPKKTTSFWTEYTTLRFEQPVEIPGEPALLGVEVMGNSNWGQFRFEIEDADGEVFKNISTGSSWGCDIMDWPGRLAVAFDGWSWVCQSLRKNTLLPDHSPATYEEQWQSAGGDKRIKYPIKLRAITIGMNRDRTTLFGFEPSVPTIRVKSVRAVQK